MAGFRGSRGIRVALAVVSASALIAASAASAGTVRYPSFQSVDGLVLNGNAMQTGNALQLTASQPGQAGSAFTQKRVVDPSQSFATNFRFSLFDSSFPGDGMTFALQGGAAHQVGEAGGGLGYQGIDNSLAVEFDLFENDEFGDPSSNYVGIIHDGEMSSHLATGQPAFDIFGGTRWAWVTYNAKKKKLRVYLNDTSKKPSKPLVSIKKNLEKLLGGKVRAGFTAGTGGNDMTTDVVSWKFSQG